MVDSNAQEESEPNESLEISEQTQLSTISPNLIYLPPDSAPTYLQRVLKEGILLATGGVAILLQIANPKIAQAVNENSDFANQPADRLRATMIYMYCVAFGTSEEKRAIIERVHYAHQQVRGPDYTADDPELQLWVAATLYVAGVDIYQKIFGDFDEAAADEVYKEYSVMATSLRVRPGMWPASRQTFREYWDEQIKTLEITSHSKMVAKDLLYNTAAPYWIRVNLPMLRLLTGEWLPARMREPYGLKSSKGRRRIYWISMRIVQRVYPILPLLVREYPLRYYLNDMRHRLKEVGEVKDY